MLDQCDKMPRWAGSSPCTQERELGELLLFSQMMVVCVVRETSVAGARAIDCLYSDHAPMKGAVQCDCLELLWV